jgi:hypothetical protein
MNFCADCDATDHDEWIVLEFNEDFSYGGVFKTKELAEAYIAKKKNRDIDGLHAVAKCHWAGDEEE